MSRVENSLPLFVLIVSASLLIRAALRTPTDVDEGYFAVAFELVAKGRVLYRDFFYPQAPLLPYLFAPFSGLIHPYFRGLRILCAFLPALTSALVSRRVYIESRSIIAALAGAAFIVTNDNVWQWLPAIKAYGAAVLFMTGALLLVTGRGRPTPWQLRGSGVLAAAAVGARLLALPIIPAVLIAVAMRHARAPAFRAVAVCGLCLAATLHPSPVVVVTLGAVAAVVMSADTGWRRILADGARVAQGLLVVAVPVCVLYSMAPEQFKFGNLGYHALRTDSRTLMGNWLENQWVTYAAVGAHYVSKVSASGPQLSLLVILALVGAFRTKTVQSRLPWLLAGVLLFAANLKPNGIHEQYFVTVVPCLALCAAGSLGDFLSVHRGWGARGGLAAVAIYYGSLAGPSFTRKTVAKIYDPWNMSSAVPAVLDDVARAVDRAERVAPGPILPSWPGHALGHAELILPGYENQFARGVADKIPEDRRRALKLRTAADFRSDLIARSATVLVLGRDVEEPMFDLATACGYEMFGPPIGSYRVYTRAKPATLACR